MRAKPEPGTRVRLTREFLRNTGQYVGGEGLSRWIIQVCSCGLCKKGGPFVAVDEIDPLGRARHFNFGNLEKV
jgi:hypothetical protein